MKILITGVTGGIASTLGYFLYKNGHKIIGIDNLIGGYLDNLMINGEEFCDFYIRDIRSDISDLLKDVDAIIHLAAKTSLPACEEDPKECFSVNTQGTLCILEAARLANIKTVIFASTSAVYENNEIFPLKEDFEINPTLSYPLSKKLSEELCQSYIKKYSFRIPILRFFNVFGPRQDIHRKSPPLINYIVREIKNGNQPILHSNGSQERDYVHVDDVCAAINECLINDQANNIYNVCSGKTISVARIYDIISDTLKFNKPAIYKSSEDFWNSYNIGLKKSIIKKEAEKYSLGDNSKITNEFGIKINNNLEELISKVALEIFNK